VSVNGSRPDQNNYQMDGVSVVNNMSGTSSAADFGIYTGLGIPNPDTIQEFKIQTSTYDASYGRNPGANVNVVTRSGTNQIRGALWEYFRNEALNANDFFYNRNPRQPGQPDKQILRQNQFGFRLGGPVLKDKLFYFGSYQGTRQLNGVAAEGTTNAFLYPIPAGDRSAASFPAALGSALCPQNRGNDRQYQTFFPSIQVACDGLNINTVALNLLRVKNTDGSYYIPGSTNGGIQNVLYSKPAKYTGDQFLANVDLLATSKHTLGVRFFRTKDAQTVTAGGQLPGWQNNPVYSNTFSVVRLTSVVNPQFINDARLSFHRNVSVANDTLPYTNQQIGLKGMIPEQTLPPVMIILGAFNIGGTLGPWNSPDTQFQLADQISWTKGKHTIRAGYEAERVQWNLVFAGLGRGFLFFGSFADFLIGRRGCAPTDGTCSPANPGTTNGGTFSNILQCLFCVRSGPNGIIHGYRLTNMNSFFQDDWKMSSRFTLNMGVRWEYNGTLGDKYGNLTNIWPSLLVPNSSVPTSAGTSSAAFAGYVVPKNHLDNYPAPPNGVLVFDGKFPSKNGIPLSAFAPRIGFAWQPEANGKIVVRGGAGIFYDRIGGDKFVHAVQEGKPYADTISYGPGGNNPFSLQTPFLERPLAFAPRYFDPVTLASSSFNSPFYETIHLPLTRQYNIGVQWEFAPEFVLDLGYVGSSGINQADYNHNTNTALLASPSQPVNGVTVNKAGNASARVPHLGFQPNGLQGTEYNGVYKYDSLQATVRKHFSRGFSFQGAYTWSKNLSNITAAGAANSNNASDMRQQYGPTAYNHPHRLVANYSWDLPTGRRNSGALRNLTQGWTVSGATVVQSGTPFTITDTGAGTAYGTAGSDPSVGLSRAQLCPGITGDQLATPGDVKQRLGGASGGPGYINKSAFCDAPAVPFSEPDFPGGPLPTEFGNSGVGIMMGPGSVNWDIALTKITRIKERHNVEFRTEFFNAFNTPHFATPGVLPNDQSNQRNAASFGIITRTVGNPRLIQFALKYSF
jgi:hypothetical protein